MARDDSGRVVFVAGALPDEVVNVEITQQKKKWARAKLVEVVEPSPHRIEPTCPEVANGCGGCDLRHVGAEHQRTLKEQIVADVLTRVGRLTELPEITTVALPDEAYRTTVRCLVVGGKAGYRQRASHDAVLVDSCPVAHPLLEELIVHGKFGEASGVTLRVGARTGERMAIVEPTADGVELPADVLVVGADELKAGKRAWIHEEVAGKRFRISADSFFQARPDGAEALAEQVFDLAGPIEAGQTVADLYGGVGLFSGLLPAGVSSTVVESNQSAAVDAKWNLEGLDATIVRVPVEKWTPDRVDVVIADPAREGLTAEAVRLISQTRSDRIVLVSCDPASMARDVGELGTYGIHLRELRIVDLFPQTSHIETVARFSR